mgnify:CR=1 FL=1
MNKHNESHRGSLLSRNYWHRAAIIASLASSLLLVACGGDDEAASVQANSAQANSAQTSQSTAAAPASSGVDVAAANTPEEIGQAVGDVYVQAFADLNDALADHPEEAEALARLREVRERHVQDLVALGRKVEALPAGGKATVQAAVSQVQSKLRYDPEIKPVYEGYTALNNHYREAGVLSSNREFNRLFASFNILTQYAFFDLLKRQNPEEAERLGL